VKSLARFAIPFVGAVVGAALVGAFTSGTVQGAIAAAKHAAAVFIKTRVLPRHYREIPTPPLK